MALPTDKLEVVLDQFEVFGIGQCQCRMAMQVMGKGCGKPLGNCMVMGQWAERGIEEGLMRQVSKKEAIEIKREAESHGLVNWMMNVRSSKGQCSCSCCGCCCHAFRMVNEFNAPGSIAPPHFLPRLDASKCSYCGKCAMNCPMAAIVVDTQHKTYRHLRERCIGCGLCVVACDRQRALAMEPVPDYQLPYRSWYSLIAQSLPRTLWGSWKLSRRRSRDAGA
jgi:Na+-translocating ferredoxin:NAD+ oxidoreductase subunit B